jgi:hypothetical protein
MGRGNEQLVVACAGTVGEVAADKRCGVAALMARSAFGSSVSLTRATTSMTSPLATGPTGPAGAVLTPD